MRGYLRVWRVDNWVKQVLVLPGVVFALFIPGVMRGLDWAGAIGILALAILGTCLVSSANYIINEFLDAPTDKFHPTKKTRTCVVKPLNAWIVWAMWLCAGAIGVGLGFFANVWIGACLGVLWGLGLLYNVKPLRVKDIAYIDILFEAANNVLRLLIGWFVITVAMFPALTIVLGYWFGCCFLLSTKRYSELRIFPNRDEAALYRKSFRHYTENSLMGLGFAFAMLSITFTTLFFTWFRLSLVFCVPLLCILFVFYLRLSFRENSVVQHPERILREPWFMLVFLMFCATFVGLLLIKIPDESIIAIYKNFSTRWW